MIPRPALDYAPAPASDLRIALFSGNYNCVRDGANRALNRLVGHLLDQGAAVRVYSPVAKHPAFPPVGDLVAVPSFGIPTRTEYRIAPRLPTMIREDIRDFAPTHVHVSAPDWLGFAAQALARRLGVPIVASMHTRFELYLRYHRLGFFEPWARRRTERFYAGSDMILVPNRPIAEEFAELGWEHKVALWGRGVDRGTFSPERRDTAWRRAHGFADDETVILFFGRLVPEKGIDLFADAVAALRGQGRRVRPLVIGDGPARDRLAGRLGEAAFVGHLEGEALGRAVASADILVNPSATEAFGNVNLEGMACGLAIVSADMPSASALLTHGRTGLLVPPADAGAYAAAIASLLDDPTARRALGTAAARASAAYGWSRSFDPVLGAYRRTARIASIAGARPGG